MVYINTLVNNNMRSIKNQRSKYNNYSSVPAQSEIELRASSE